MSLIPSKSVGEMARHCCLGKKTGFRDSAGVNN